jgi:starvation-inducible DNA-binding protein
MDIDIGIEKNALVKINQALSCILADTLLLSLKTKGFHWNVKGPHFKDLHDLFDEQHEEMVDAIDVMAERIRALGYKAPASFTEFRRLSTLDDVDYWPKASDMVLKLHHDHETISQKIRLIIPEIEPLNDYETVDLLTDRLHAHTKAAWMLRSILEE